MSTIDELAHDFVLLRARGESVGVPCWRSRGHRRHARGAMWPGRGRCWGAGDRVRGQDRADETGERRRAGDRCPVFRGARWAASRRCSVRSFLASMRAVEPSTRAEVDAFVEAFHALAAILSELSHGGPVLPRWSGSRRPKSSPYSLLQPSTFVIGRRVDPGVHSCDSFLHRN